MSVFALAIVERIAETVQIPALADGPSETGAAKGLIQIAADAVERRDGDEFWVVSSPEDRQTAESFASFLCLFELGVRTGYLSLSDWPDADAAREVAQGVRMLSPSLALLDEFINRQPSADGPPRDAVGFAGFESYLMLMHRLLRDQAVRRYLDDSWSGAPAEGDWALLISPRHFAEAFGTGRIAGVPVTDPSAAIRLLALLEWLRDIVAGVPDQTALREGILRHASGWLDKALPQQQRLDTWVRGMREWDVDAEDLWTPESWSTYCDEVFGPLTQERTRIDEADAHVISAEPIAFATPGLEQQAVAEPSLEERAAQLVAEGRRSAARDVMRSDALGLAASGPSDTKAEGPWFAWAQALVSKCVLLADLGDELAASAIVAPTAKRLLEEYGSSPYAVVDEARALLARARDSAKTVAPAEAITYASPKPEIHVEQAGAARNELRARSIGI